MGGNETQDLPVINLSDKNMKPGTELWNSTRNSVREAMEHHGWFVAEYNSFPAELHKSVLEASKELLDLPPEVKVKNENHKAGHGYITMSSDDQPVHEGLGIDQANDIQQCRRFSSLMWPDHHNNDRFWYYLFIKWFNIKSLLLLWMWENKIKILKKSKTWMK